MLLNLYKKKWIEGLKLEKFDILSQTNGETLKDVSTLAESYQKWIAEETKKTK